MGYKSIGRQLQLAREQAGYSQEQLAAKIGCSQSTLSNYEKGRRRIYLAQLEKIAEILNKPVQFFLQPIDHENAVRQEVCLPAAAPSEATAAVQDIKSREQNLLALFQSLSPEGQQLIMDFALWLKKREVGENG
ncbi:helix-turn-helix domain-containing protein [Desulfotruncus alcoholivorax]|uniref:helix-turn-helix domain-containing protein n=1 Tax=Desulfotruncus alcoholivorax TaxID=265477 RepID=UPI00041F8EC2|nr:helix-turn-helix transcriptional regulator [Desulfotruncus alcoholivorax]